MAAVPAPPLLANAAALATLPAIAPIAAGALPVDEAFVATVAKRRRLVEEFNQLGTATDNELGEHLVYEHQVCIKPWASPQTMMQQWLDWFAIAIRFAWSACFAIGGSP